MNPSELAEKRRRGEVIRESFGSRPGLSRRGEVRKFFLKCPGCGERIIVVLTGEETETPEVWENLLLDVSSHEPKAVKR